MRLSEQKYSYLITRFFPDNILCGFTKTNIHGLDIPQDMRKVAGELVGEFSVAYLNQIHSPHTSFIDSQGVYRGDGLLTQEKGIMLVVKTADCLPVFVYDKKNSTIGMIHLGWRSARSGIIDATGIDFSCATIIAGIGLRSCCYRVGEEFLGYDSFVPFLQRRKKNLYFDPVSFLGAEIVKRGGTQEQLQDIKLCSYCSTKGYSFRRQKTNKRTLSFIVKL